MFPHLLITIGHLLVRVKKMKEKKKERKIDKERERKKERINDYTF